jgi:hypothetical protein
VPVIDHEYDQTMLELLAELGSERSEPRRYCIDMLLTKKATLVGERFWPERRWIAPGVSREVIVSGAHWVLPERHDYVTRATFYYNGAYAHFGPRAIFPTTTVDASGLALDGAKHYRMRLPADVPVSDSWEITAYSLTTRKALDTPSHRLAVSSASPVRWRNDDGSIDVEFAPVPPLGREGNWIATRPGEPLAVVLRFYEPLPRLLERRWIAGDLELVP